MKTLRKEDIELAVALVLGVAIFITTIVHMIADKVWTW